MRNEGKPQKSTKTIRELWIALGILVILTPLGLIVPAWFGAGGAWGEWGAEEIKKLIGYVPAGMEKLSHLWKSPMHDYTVPGQKPGLVRESLGYIAAAIIGVGITGGLAYALAKLLERKNKSE